MQDHGGRLAIEDWQRRQAAIPAAAPRDRAARHLYCGPSAPAPPVVPPPPPAPVVPPPPAPQVPPPIVPPAPVVQLRSGRISRPATRSP
eukprot:1738574-Rhodomonas_salina.1